ncbi:MAG TPA: sigma 54-interacting transcriptional regulator [Candidatus Methylomirabilis sp.]|nr:sigma 54-interacting transcriptional regulator [Candidatus Methylomirabilis sp.]
MTDQLSKTPTASGTIRTLMEVTAAIDKQTNVQAVLKSLHKLLSAVVHFDSIGIGLLTHEGNSLRLIAFERGPAEPQLELGTETPYSGTGAGRAIEEQRTVHIPDVREELLKFPGMVSQTSTTGVRSAYMVPLSTPRRKLGVLSFARRSEGGATPDELAIMQTVTSHVATALESAMASDAAESYQKQLLGERDRWKLLLEINNHVIAFLDVTTLLRSACESLRNYFDNDFAAVWIIDKEQNRLETAAMDFPSGRGFIDDVTVELTAEDIHRMKTRQPELWGQKELQALPETVRESFASEGLESMLVTALRMANRPLGVITLGSKRAGHFRHQDLDLLGQIATQISLALDNAMAYEKLNASRDQIEEERLYLETELRAEYNFENIVGRSPSLIKVLQQIQIVAPTDSTVLLHGETGTGKELIARAIHSLSSRKSRTFVRLNCAAIPSGLVESELFGHEKGAFTGALMQKKGRFEIADQGTLFLDEIGDISLDLQPKLLRALQEQEFERLGSARTIRVDVRLIAATHRDLPTMIRNNQFREDLFYRLNVFPIEIPPLRDRREDIPLLVNFFVSRLSRKMQKNIESIPKDAMEALTNAPWPGNIRELENFIERAVILTQGSDLKVPLKELKRAPVVSSATSGSTFEEAERQAIVEALHAAAGKISGQGGAAERLGLKRTTLQNKMRKLGISRLRAEAKSGPTSRGA